MRIVVLDGHAENPGDLSWDDIAALGDLAVYDRTPAADKGEVVRRIGDAEVVLTNKTPIDREVIDACPGLGFIGILATGYNVVDVAYARERGIAVSNVPAYGTDTVAQFTIALLLEVCHHVGHHDQTVKEGGWERSRDFCYWEYPQVELAGKTMGIIGFGRIGQKTGTIARALGMRVLAHSPHASEAGKVVATYVDLDTLLAQSDVVALHCPLFDSTRGIINKDTIAKMKDGVIILNSARGPLIVEQDLADALDRGKVAAAGLDVVGKEPIRSDNPLLRAKNCVITPHIAWATREARQRIMDTTCENVKAYLAGSPINLVN